MAIEESTAISKAIGSGPMERTGAELGRKADHIGERVSSNVRDKAHDLQERAGDVRTKLTDRVHGGRQRLETEVQARPMRTLLWAAGVAAVLGLMIGRRSRR